MYFTWFDRVRRALQNCICQKSLSRLFEVKLFKKHLEDLNQCQKTDFFNATKNTRFFIKLTLFIHQTFQNVLIRYSFLRASIWYKILSEIICP